MPLKMNPEELPTINLTSMIDVVFLLLIFFMVGTRFSDQESQIPINLPKVNPYASVNEQAIQKVVHVHRDGSIEMDQRRMTLSEITRTLSGVRQLHPETSVVLRPDAMLPSQNLMEVLAAVQQAGIQRTAVGANPPSLTR